MRPGKTSITGHTFCPSGKVDSDDFSHKKWALACANAQNQTHYLSYKPKTQERRSIERRSLSVLLIALRRVAKWHAKGVEQRPFAFRINKLRATSGEWAGRQCAKGVGRVAPPASRVSESLKKRRKRRLLRVRDAERKGGARPASRSLSRWMLTTGKFIQAKLTRVNTFLKESFLW